MQYDLTRPNSGRMIDYWLGGSHNFEIDRQLADQMEKQFPFMRQFSADDRAFTGRCVAYFHKQGLDTIVDFGSSLPTCHNTHLVAHALSSDIQVVYSDIDPITVAYGKELLADTRNVIYLHNDAANPLGVLNAPETRALIGEERRVGIIFNALAHLMPDDRVRAAWQTLYDWVSSGSCMSVGVPSEQWLTDPQTSRVLEMYKRSGLVSYMRTRDQYTEMVSPWRVTEEGIANNFEWGLPQKAQPALFYSMMLSK